MERFSSQSSNSLQSINSILSDEANTSMLSFTSSAVPSKYSRPENTPVSEAEAQHVPKVKVHLSEESKMPVNEGVTESASQSLTDILDNVRPPQVRPPSGNRELLTPSYRGSQESLAESINKSIASNPDLSSSMIKLPGGRVLQKHVDTSRIDLERQQKVIIK